MIPTQANYVTCEIISRQNKHAACTGFTRKKYFYKRFVNKKGFDGRNYIRIAVKNEEDNDKLIAALKKKIYN